MADKHINKLHCTDEEPSFQKISDLPKNTSLLHGRTGPQHLDDLRPVRPLCPVRHIFSISVLHAPTLTLSTSAAAFAHIFFPFSTHPLDLCLFHSRPASRSSFLLHLYFCFGLISILPEEPLPFSRAAPLNPPEADRS